MTLHRANILIVDDIPDNLLLIEAVLEDVDGYQLVMANGGEEALLKISEHPPDLILLDVMMPDIDGYEVTKQVRKNKALSYIPILLVTAHDESSLTKGLDAGADDFIRKPFDSNELIARVRALLRLKHSMDGQAEMIRQRDDVVSRLTHDLRTPLVAATRVLEQIKKGTFGDSIKTIPEVFDEVISNNENLLEMANTLLQVYRHEAGKKEIASTPLCMRTLTQEVVQSLNPLADEKKIELTFEADSYHEDSVDRVYQTQGDLIELRRLLTNLVGNAIKFTDTGKILVKLSLTAPDKDTVKGITGEHIAVAVTDTGIGIEAESQAKIFDWFQQGNHMRAGSGLGLHLSQRIAQMHGGRITLASQKGEGSTFTLWLPKLEAN